MQCGRLARRTVFPALALVGACVGLLVVADDADASHFWSGAMSWSDPTGTGTAYEIEAYVSLDTKWFGNPVPICFIWGATNTCQHPGRPLMCDAPLTGYLVVDQPKGSGYTRVLWGPNGLNNVGRLMVDDVEVPFSFLVVDQDVEHCRVIGKLTTYGSAAPLVVPSPSRDPFTVSWHLDARDDNEDDHVNNQNVRAAMLMTINPSVVNQAPVIDFAGSYAPPYLSEAGYGNLHCPQDSICTFNVRATDPDGDALTFRLATSDEATGGADLPPPNPGVSLRFQHPGPDCLGCVTGPYSIDKNTGLGTWDTAGASVGEVYSTQIIVSDGKADVPIDFMIEIVEPPEPCWDSSSPVIDPDTGAIICPVPPPDDCPPGTFRKDPGNPYSECIFPEEPEYQPVRGEPRPAAPFWMPEPSYGPEPRPARSELGHHHVHPSDRVNERIAQLDHDGDGVRDRDDLCLDDALTQDQDLDGDGIGDACDDDMDGDGVQNALDPCSFDAGDLCATTSDPPEAQTLGTTTLGDLLAGAGQPEGRGEAESVRVDEALVEESRAVGPWFLVLLGAALLVLLLAMARRRR